MEYDRRFQNSLRKLQKAYFRLEEACKEEKDQYVQDSVIQRFEFTFELLWKTLKYYLLIQWIEKNSPREVIIESFKQ